MKWIGQHIWSFISRFRNDVYLEDISSGTIASGGNLGLDTNNKIVKATEASGDITGVTITTDSGGGSAASDTAGSADFSILGNNGVGVTNSGTTITAVAVPGEIDHDSLLNFDENEHFTQANITTVGTIDEGVWNGTAITYQYINADQRNITGVGTIGSGVWEGTAIATDQQKHLAYFEFKGYGTSDGTNYEMLEEMTDANAPFEHNTSTGSDGLTAQTIQTVMRSGGTVMPHSGTLKKFTGWVTSAGSGTINVALFKFTPTDDSAGNLTPVRLVNEQTTASGNAIMNSFSETSSFDAGFTAGDIIYPAVLGINTKAFYYNSVLEVEWS